MYSAVAAACIYSIGGKGIGNKRKLIYGKVVAFMLEQETKILKTFALIIPKLSESDKGYLLGLGEGMAIKTDGQETADRQGIEETKLAAAAV